MRVNSSIPSFCTTNFSRAFWRFFFSPRRAKTRPIARASGSRSSAARSEEHTSELQSHVNLVCRLLLEKKKTINPLNRRRIQAHDKPQTLTHVDGSSP